MISLKTHHCEYQCTCSTFHIKRYVILIHIVSMNYHSSSIFLCNKVNCSACDVPNNIISTAHFVDQILQMSQLFMPILRTRKNSICEKLAHLFMPILRTRKNSICEKFALKDYSCPYYGPEKTLFARSLHSKFIHARITDQKKVYF